MGEVREALTALVGEVREALTALVGEVVGKKQASDQKQASDWVEICSTSLTSYQLVTVKGSLLRELSIL